MSLRTQAVLALVLLAALLATPFLLWHHTDALLESGTRRYAPYPYLPYFDIRMVKSTCEFAIGIEVILGSVLSVIFAGAWLVDTAEKMKKKRLSELREQHDC